MNDYETFILKAKKGDIEAFASLYELVYTDMYRFALYTLKNKHDAEDAVSDTITDAFASIKKLRHTEAFHGWIFKILSINCKKRLKQYIKPPLPLPDDLTQMQENLEERHDLRVAFATLQEEERLILSMGIFGGYKSHEIGSILHMNSSTVRSKRHRALEKLHIHLQDLERSRSYE